MKNITKRLFKILKRPSETFEEISDEPIGESYKYFLILTIILALLIMILGSIYIVVVMAGFFEKYPLLKWSILPIILFLFPALSFCILFLCSFILHIFVLIFSGKGGINKTIKSVIYSSTPSILSLWFPPLFLISLFWSFSILYIGIKNLHKMNSNKVIICLLLPIVIIFGISLLVAFTR